MRNVVAVHCGGSFPFLVSEIPIVTYAWSADWPIVNRVLRVIGGVALRNVTARQTVTPVIAAALDADFRDFRPPAALRNVPQPGGGDSVRHVYQKYFQNRQAMKYQGLTGGIPRRIRTGPVDVARRLLIERCRTVFVGPSAAGWRPEGPQKWQKCSPCPWVTALRGKLLVADAQGAAAVPEVVREHWDWLGWIFETNGTAALARLRSARPALVIVNLQLPDMCGTSLVERIRKGRPYLPIVVTSDHVADVSEKVARAMGIVAYMPKPAHPEVFDQVLQLCLRGVGGDVKPTVETDTVGGE